jgi:hypothetical protein
MPNRAYTRIWRAVGAVAIVIGALSFINPLWALFSELHARHNWSHSKAQIAYARVVDAPENRSPGGNPSTRSTRTVYWVEFEVNFQPTDGCRTGTSIAPSVDTHFPCSAIIHSAPHESPASAYAWLARHPSGASAEVLHDPKGPGVKFANESFADLLPWNRIALALIFLALGIFLWSAANHRLAGLAYLPKGEDLPAPQSARKSNPDELIDLKLS